MTSLNAAGEIQGFDAWISRISLCCIRTNRLVFTFKKADDHAHRNLRPAVL